MSNRDIYGPTKEEILAKAADELLNKKGFSSNGEKKGKDGKRGRSPIIYTPMRCK